MCLPSDGVVVYLELKLLAKELRLLLCISRDELFSLFTTEKQEVDSILGVLLERERSTYLIRLRGAEVPDREELGSVGRGGPEDLTASA